MCETTFIRPEGRNDKTSKNLKNEFQNAMHAIIIMHSSLIKYKLCDKIHINICHLYNI